MTSLKILKKIGSAWFINRAMGQLWVTESSGH